MGDKIEYYLYYNVDFNFTIEELIVLIGSIEGIGRAYSKQHLYYPEKTVIVFSVNNAYKEPIVYQKVLDVLLIILKDKHFSLREKIW